MKWGVTLLALRKAWAFVKRKVSMKQTFGLLFAAMLLTGCARDRGGIGNDANSGSVTGSSSGTVGSEESAFAREACQAGVAGMEIGKLAARNTKNEAVRNFARRLVEDHTAAEKDLGAIFARKSLSAEPKLGEHYEQSITSLATLKGGEFDRAFKRHVIETHERAITSFEKQATEGDDPDLKAFAQKHLPHLRAHLEIARALPISSDTEGPPADASLNQVLQHPAPRLNIPR